MKVTRIGVDLAKHSFQVHGVDDHDKVVVRKQLTRGKMLAFFAQLPPCLIGMEACGSAHDWARALGQLGHTGRLMAPQCVQPYGKNPQHDGNDAEAICEAVSRPPMRFVPIQAVEQQAVLTVHRARALLVGDRTALVHQIRGLLAESGMVVPQGIARWRRAFPGVLEATANGLPPLAREIIAALHERLQDVAQRLLAYERRITQLAKQHDAAQRLMQGEGVGAITATAIVATVGNGTVFKHGRQFAAWLGLVPRQHSTGGTQRLGHISKRGDVYLRTLLIHGARSVRQYTGTRPDAKSRWAERLKQRRGNNMAAGALAAQPARLLWALLARDQAYRLAASRSARPYIKQRRLPEMAGDDSCDGIQGRPTLAEPDNAAGP